MSETRQVCTFTVAGGLFGLEVSRVQEVLRHQEMTRVTLARRFIRGLINLRGQIVMAIDLRRCLDLPDAPDDAPPMNLVVRADDGPVSFLVDKIHDVIDVETDAFEPPPPNLHGPTRRIVRETYPLGGSLLLLVDADAVLALIEGPGDP
jgi:purine-binding chemotaxis protein CheW